MEHSFLHAVQLLGIVVVLGGAVLVLALLNPARRALGPGSEVVCRALSASALRWVRWGALVGAGSALGDLFVQTAEVQGQTIFGGVDPALAVRFATTTTVGQLVLLRALALLLVAVAARRSGARNWWLVGVLGLAAAFLASLVSHAAAQPIARGTAVLSQFAHITAAALWIGVLIHLLAARASLAAATEPQGLALVADIIRRFSPIAAAMVSVLALSGIYTVGRLVCTPTAIPASAYGLTLVIKLVLLVPLLGAGFVNFRVIRPALLSLAARAKGAAHGYGPALEGVTTASHERAAAGVLRRFGRLLELEVTAGVLVIAVAGILGSVTPPGADGSARLTDRQVWALLSPDLPTTAIEDPGKLYDSPEHTQGDERYSEFTHNWSGMFVCLLGLGWLAQSRGGRMGAVAARLWPLLLVPFAAFVAVAADPEVWLLRRLTVREALSNPQILEHHVGALMVVVLAVLGWRDQRKAAVNRPLGYALPVLMIFGSLLLLGHAHSTLDITVELSNLITVQHAVLGGLGLFAGVVRWFSLRRLFPERAARVVWPALIVAAGVFLAFFYREVV
jgi:putative copper export protein